jgi:hypothetical protein
MPTIMDEPILAVSLHAIIAGKKLRISLRKPLAKQRTRPPSHFNELGTVEEFARRAVGTRLVEQEFTLVVNDLGDELGEVRDRHLLAAAEIEVRFAGIVLQNEYTGIGEVVYEKNSRRGVPVPHTVAVGAPSCFD